MNRTNICKMIIQFIKDYITNPTKLEPHRAKNHFIRNRKLSMLQVIMYLFYSSKASMYQNLACIRDDLADLDFPNISKQALSKARQFINPSLFKELYYLYETGFRQKEQALWSSVTVRRILENEVYIGNLVQGKRTTPNHKVKQSYVKPEDDWIRIEKNHEPLVNERDFEIVQRLLGMDTRTSPDQKQVYLLSGIAVCADCGAPMTRKVSTVGGKKYAYYLCSTNKETKRCSSHRIPEKDLENVVLVMLKQHIQNIMHLKRVLEFIGTVPFQEINVKKLQDRLEKKKMETERCKELRMMLYSDMKEGIVSKEDYVELHAAYGKRLRNAEESIRAIQKEMDNMLEKADASNTWLDYFVKYQDIEVLTRTVIVELIREIRVHDKKNIEIVFDFDDCYQALLTQLPAMGVEVATDPDNNLQVKIKEVV